MSQNTTPIITLEDKQGDQFFPVTHVDAVIDANGGTVSTLLSGKQNTLVSGTNIKTINNNSILGSGNINIQGGGITSGTWSEIKSLRDEHALVPGTWYRITNYCATTSQSYTSSAEVYFDILLLATSEDTFSEEAKAAMNSDWESEHDYFSSAGSNLDAWKIWYCIDNDIDRFGWAHNNGKGVIYRMIDEFGNDCPYDFKGIKFIINSERYASDWMNAILGSTNQTSVFTFDAFYSYPSSPSDQDASVWNQSDFGYDSSQYGQTARVGTINNKIEPAYDATDGTFRVQILNGNVFVDSDRSTLFNGFQENVLRQNCTENVFGSGATGNILNIGCHKNYFFDSCKYNFLDTGCNENMFAYGSGSNKFGPGCYNNSSYASMNNVILGPGCNLNSFGYASDCKLGSECFYISLYHNENIVFEKGCNNISISELSYNIKFASNCHHIDFNANNQHDIVFKFPTYYSHFNDNWSNVQIENLSIYNGENNRWTTWVGVTSQLNGGGWHFGRVGGSGCDFYRDSEFSDYVVYSGYASNQFLCTPSNQSGSVGLRRLKYDDLPADVAFGSLSEEMRPLTFKILTNGTITWKHAGSAKTIYYSKNGGIWQSLTSTTSGTSISVSAGDTLVFYGSTTWPGESSSTYRTFGGSARFDVYGNPASLRYGTNLSGKEALAENCYRSLFGGASIRRGPILPAETLPQNCYNAMFRNSYIESLICLATSKQSNSTTNWLSVDAAGEGTRVITVKGSIDHSFLLENIPSGFIIKTDTGGTFVKTSVDWRSFNKEQIGGTEYTTKTNACNASGLGTNTRFDNILNGKYKNAALEYYNTSTGELLIAEPAGYYCAGTDLDKSIYWTCNNMHFGIHYDSTSGYYYLYGNTDIS